MNQDITRDDPRFISIDGGRSYWTSDSPNQGYIGHLLHHHVDQNTVIARDLLKEMDNKPEFKNALGWHSAIRVIEVGCGTGELIKMLITKYGGSGLGLDISPQAIGYANSNLAVPGTLEYRVFNMLDYDQVPSLGKYDISICSNTLEHFRNPWPVIDAMLSISRLCLILVPYDQPVTDGYDGEGGAGHVYRFTRDSFSRYTVKASFLFSTPGWQCSTSAFQFAIILAN